MVLVSFLRNAHVNFAERNKQTEIGIALYVFSDFIRVKTISRINMELETNTVNRNALLFQFLNKIEHGISFSLSHRFIGIIIKEKLCRRVALMGFCKGVLNIVFSDCFKPDCFPQRAVVLKGFVYNVVFFDSALIALHNR